MAFLDELGRRFNDVSRVVMRKTKEITDIGGLKIQIVDENRKLSKLYENLGKKYFEIFRDHPHEEVEDLVDQLREAIEGIQKLEDDIARVEAESAAKAEADRIRREAEAAARREAVAEAQMREIEDEHQTSKEDTEDSEIPEEQPENETLEETAEEAGSEEETDADDFEEASDYSHEPSEEDIVKLWEKNMEQPESHVSGEEIPASDIQQEGGEEEAGKDPEKETDHETEI